MLGMVQSLKMTKAGFGFIFILLYHSVQPAGKDENKLLKCNAFVMFTKGC